MKLPHLTQLVLLDRHMAQLVGYYLQAEQRALIAREPGKQRLGTTEALTLEPLARVLKKLAKLQLRDQQPLAPPPARLGRKPRKAKPRKPHKLKLDYAELTTVRLYYARMLAAAAATPEQHLALATALGRFHQPSLNLEGHIRLPAAFSIGSQLDLF